MPSNPILTSNNTTFFIIYRYTFTLILHFLIHLCYTIAKHISYESAIAECIKEEILTEFLIQNRAEVISMSIFEYDKDEEEQAPSRRLLSFHSLYIFTQSTIFAHLHDARTPA